MRVEITLNSRDEIIIPKSYNHILQGVIYKLLDPILRRFLHNQGYEYGKRRFKLFTFSRLLGKFKTFDDYFQFTPPIRLFISSLKVEILQSLAENFLKEEKVLLGKNKVFIESICVLPKIYFDREVIIKMLSPLIVYSTLKKSDGSKKTYYYSPFEDEFNILIGKNLRKKYEVIFGEEPSIFNFEISPYKVKPSDEKVIIYKKYKTKQEKPTIIKGWMGLYRLRGEPKIIELSYDCGLGSKNSLGFGCWEIFRNMRT